MINSDVSLQVEHLYVINGAYFCDFNDSHGLSYL